MTAAHDSIGNHEAEAPLAKFVVTGLLVLGYATAIGAFLIPVINYLLVVD